MKNIPKVSIICITYNQEKYIKQALDSFIKQKTNFKFEILIGDDCSTDGTPMIIREYKKKYSEIIKPIYRNKNIGAMENLKDLLIKAKGKYISLCEGDDYFISNNKLQIQSDFLDKHSKYSICFHPVKVFFEKKEEIDFIYPNPNQLRKFSVNELLKWNFIQTNSVLYRNLHKYKDIPTDILPGDWYLHLYHAKYGKIGFINKIMSAYRKHSQGLWWNYKYDIDKLLIKNGIKQIKLYLEIIKLHISSNTESVDNNIDYTLKKFLELDSKYKTKLYEESFLKFPNEMIEFFSRRYKDTINYETQPKNCNNDSEKLKEITDSELYKLWPVYTKIKRIVFGFLHKIH